MDKKVSRMIFAISTTLEATWIPHIAWLFVSLTILETSFTMDPKPGIQKDT